MYKIPCFIFALLVAATFSFSAQDAASAVEGTVKKIDAGSKIIVVKTADGAEHTFHFADHTAVHGTRETERVSKDSFHGLKEGSEVVVHYTKKGAAATAEEIDRIGKDGLSVGEGSIKEIDRNARILTVKTAGGAEETYGLTDHAAEDAGKDIEKGGKKSEKVTVYYTEEAGHKIAHFFKRVI